MKKSLAAALLIGLASSSVKEAEAFMGAIPSFGSKKTKRRSNDTKKRNRERNKQAQKKAKRK